MENGKNVDDAIFCLQTRLYSSRNRGSRIRVHGIILLASIGANMASRYYLENVIVVQWNVPLYVAGAIFQDVFRIGHQGSIQWWVKITMLSCRSLISDRITHHHHLGNGDIFLGEQFTTYILYIFV